MGLPALVQRQLQVAIGRLHITAAHARTQGQWVSGLVGTQVVPKNPRSFSGPPPVSCFPPPSVSFRKPADDCWVLSIKPRHTVSTTLELQPPPCVRTSTFVPPQWFIMSWDSQSPGIARKNKRIELKVKSHLWRLRSLGETYSPKCIMLLQWPHKGPINP